MLPPYTVASFIEDTARKLILPRFQALKPKDLWEKSPGNPVTIADIEAERELTRLLTAALPGSVVLGEESAAEDPTRFALVAQGKPLWIIDPIDGTANFARGDPAFAVIIAYVESGRTRMGWIYDPVGGRMLWSIAGGGTWFEDRRIAVDPVAPGRQLGSAYGKAASGQRAEKALEASGEIGGVRNLGCCGLEYQAIALGELHFSLHSRSLPWDHAAGMLTVAEAGGKAGFLDGADYDLGVHDRPVLAAADSAGWNRVRDIVTKPGSAQP